MAISLKRYTPQVKVSGEGTAVELSADLAAKAASAGSRVMQTAAEGVSKFNERKVEIERQLEQRRQSVEQNLLKSKIDGELKVANAIYESSREGNTDYSTWGTDNDNDLTFLKQTYDNILTDPTLQQYPQLLAETQINLDYAFQERQSLAKFGGLAKMKELATERLNASIGEAIEQNNAEEVARLIDQAEFDGIFSQDDAATQRVEVPRLLDEAQITNLVASNPLEFIKRADEQIAGTSTYYENVSLDYLRSQKNTAKAAWNNNATFIAEDLWEKTYEAIRTGNTDALDQIRADAILADENDTIPTKEANDIIELTRNPYGESKSISLEEQSKLFNEVSTYDPTTDLDNSEYLRISNLINHISNPTIKTDLRKVLANSKNGELQGFAYNDIMEIIDGENRPDTFGIKRLGLSEEETIFAKQEVVKYLRENPNDYEGALKLYRGISASKGNMQSKQYFRTTYGYSTPTTTATQLSDDDLYNKYFPTEGN